MAKLEFYPDNHIDVVDYYTSNTTTNQRSHHVGTLWDDNSLERDVLETRVERIKQSNVIHNWWRSFSFSMWLYLVLLGVFSAFIGYFLDYSTLQIRTIILDIASISVRFIDYIIWTFICTLFLLIAMGCVYYISRDASGSGIPEMKAFLAGADMEHEYLSVRTLTAKIFGLLAALSTGLSIGKVGPFVHIASCLAHLMFQIPFFSSLNKNLLLRRQLYAAAIAAGVSMTFGTPVSAVFFSIEVTATYFLVANLWKTFFCATWCVFTLKVFHEFGTVSFFDDTTFDRFKVSFELFAFALLGILCGLMSAAFTWISWKWMVLQRTCTIVCWENPRANVDSHHPLYKQYYLIMKQYVRYYTNAIIRNRVLFAMCVLIITASLQWMFTALRNFDRITINEMFDELSLSGRDLHHWTRGSIHSTMVLFCICKFALTSVSISLPIPCGILTPVFALGAVFGRLYGELWQLVLPHVSPGRYAIVGAAALSSGVTRTLSIVIMVFELTGQLTNLLPVMIAVLFSYSVANGLSLSVYDMILNVKDLPYLPNMSHTSGSNITQLLDSEVICFHQKSTFSQIHRALLSQYYTIFPFVDAPNHRIVIGAIGRDRLQTIVKRHINRFREQLSATEDAELTTFIDHQRQASRIIRGESTTPFSSRVLSVWKRILSWFSQTNTNVLRSTSSQNYRRLDTNPDTPSSEMELQRKHTNTTWEEAFREHMNVVIDWHPLIQHHDIDTAPLCLSEHTPLPRLHYYFAMLGIHEVIITARNGSLVGIVSKSHLHPKTHSRVHGLQQRSSPNIIDEDDEEKDDDDDEEIQHNGNNNTNNSDIPEL